MLLALKGISLISHCIAILGKNVSTVTQATPLLQSLGNTLEL